ncbi:MAG: NYN domain-containing protein [Anaerolineaceae bacterium]|nr:MAG: NYN domain-containing protein [Anaerolineaceae bacterium]
MNDNAQVAVFIDYDNIEISTSDKLGKDVDVEWSLILEAAAQIGRVVVRRAYADWSSYGGDRQRELLGSGVELVHVSSKRGKNAADIRIVIDALEFMAGGNSNITHIMLVSGDGDFTELVHRLRGRGIKVVGLGVSGASAEYLINACDEFIFYDRLVGAEQPIVESDGGGEDTPAAPSFDITEARQLLRRVLQSREGEWVLAAELKNAMLRLDPAFSERNYGFPNFKEFINAAKDVVETQLNENNQIEVTLTTAAASQIPEALLDEYLKILAEQKVRMTPNEYRPQIIFRFFDICTAHPEYSLTSLKEHVHAYFQESAPHVKWQYVHEAAHQLFHTYCFEFDQSEDTYPPETRLWDRKVFVAAGVEKSLDLLDKCDKGLLFKLARALGSPKKINKEAAARLLYGSFRGQAMLDHVGELIDGLKTSRSES